MPRIRTLAPLALLSLALAILAAVLIPRSRSVVFNGTDLGTATPAADFTLRSADGDVSLSDFRGRVTLLFFGYTSCPDVCPLTMAKLRRVTEELGEDAAGVQVVLVSVDPEVDTPVRVAGYVHRFDPGFLGLTGTRAEIQAVAATYGVYAGESTDAGTGPVAGSDSAGAGHTGHAAPKRLIAHSSQVFGIDRDGRFRLLWGADLPADAIAADVRELLRP